MDEWKSEHLNWHISLNHVKNFKLATATAASMLTENVDMTDKAIRYRIATAIQNKITPL